MKLTQSLKIMDKQHMHTPLNEMKKKLIGKKVKRKSITISVDCIHGRLHIRLTKTKQLKFGGRRRSNNPQVENQEKSSGLMMV